MAQTHISRTPVLYNSQDVGQFQLQVESTFPLRLKLHMMAGLPSYAIHSLHSRQLDSSSIILWVSFDTQVTKQHHSVSFPIRNIYFVGNLILSTSCKLYYDDVTVTSFINIKYKATFPLKSCRNSIEKIIHMTDHVLLTNDVAIMSHHQKNFYVCSKLNSLQNVHFGFFLF